MGAVYITVGIWVITANLWIFKTQTFDTSSYKQAKVKATISFQYEPMDQLKHLGGLIQNRGYLINNLFLV